jgi:hypothetical protein
MGWPSGPDTALLPIGVSFRHLSQLFHLDLNVIGEREVRSDMGEKRAEGSQKTENGPMGSFLTCLRRSWSHGLQSRHHPVLRDRLARSISRGEGERQDWDHYFVSWTRGSWRGSDLVVGEATDLLCYGGDVGRAPVPPSPRVSILVPPHLPRLVTVLVPPLVSRDAHNSMSSF